MNRARVAQLLRELADEIEAPNDVDEIARARAKRKRREPMLTRPDGEASPVAAGQARKILRDRGFA